MKTSAKVLLAAGLIVVVALLIYTPILAEPQDEYKGLNGELRRRMALKQRLQEQLRERFQERFWRFIKNSVPVEVKGKVVAVVNNLLVLEKEGGGQLRVLLPSAWYDDDGKVYKAKELVENKVLEVGKEATVKALEATVKVNDKLSISILLGYEITQGTTHIYALLPLNIETSG